MSKPRKRRAWQPLQPAEAGDPGIWTRFGMRAPDTIYVNDLYSVYVREIGHGALHISFHRHNRAAVRDWRHFQAIKNEVAGPERLAIEVFPPESLLTDEANEYHLWVLPEGAERDFPFLLPVTSAADAEPGSNVGGRCVGTQQDMQAQYGRSKARQRDWQPGIPTGLGVHAVNTSTERSDP